MTIAIPGSHIGIRVAPNLDDGRFERQLPYEVSVHHIAHGTYVSRHPGLTEGRKLSKIVPELFLVTDGSWKGHRLTCSRPFVYFDDDLMSFYNPEEEVINPFLELPLKKTLSREEALLLLNLQLLSVHAFTQVEKRMGRDLLASIEVKFFADGEGRLSWVDVVHVEKVAVLGI